MHDLPGARDLLHHIGVPSLGRTLVQVEGVDAGPDDVVVVDDLAVVLVPLDVVDAVQLGQEQVKVVPDAFLVGAQVVAWDRVGQRLS